jgi:hypothetical protein
LFAIIKALLISVILAALVNPINYMLLPLTQFILHFLS